MWRRAVFLTVVSTALVTACTHDFDQFRFDDPPGDGGSGPGPGAGVGGGGGQGGTAQGGAGTGGAGTGGMGECTTAAQCPGVDTDCQMRGCVDSTCVISYQGVGAPCDDNGGIKCDGIGHCVACLMGSDCASGVCVNQLCQPASCSDTVMNGDETDVDCGGSCPPCANTLMCVSGVDCSSGYCMAGICTPCVQDVDCVDVPNTYCDTGVCTPTKVDGSACAGANECTSGFCPGDDGVCCDLACEQTCEACVMAKTGMADGSCAVVTATTDPDNECTADATNCIGDTCGGVAGVCGPAMVGVLCRAAVGVCDADELCDGVMPACPADGKHDATTTCRAAVGGCDTAEVCDGVADACPADMVAPATTACRAAADLCDAVEFCDGVGKLCPADAPLPAGNNCRASAAPCDAPEFCDGVAFSCPADALVADDQASLGDVCDPYLCDGAMASCPTSCGSDGDCVQGLSCVGTTCQ